MKNEGGIVSENVNDTGKSTLESVVENQETAAANEVDAPETKTIQEGDMEAAINQKAAILLEDVDDSDKSIINDDVLREKSKVSPTIWKLLLLQREL